MTDDTLEHRARTAAPRPASGPARRTDEARLLLAGAVLSVLVAAVLQRVFFIVTSELQLRTGEVVMGALGFVVPLVLVLAALSRVPTGAVRRAVALGLAVLASTALLVGLFLDGLAWLVGGSLGCAALLAAWLLVHRAPPVAWLLLVAPAAAIVGLGLVGILARAVFDATDEARPVLWQAESMLAVVLPLAVTAAGAMLVPGTRRGRLRLVGSSTAGTSPRT